MLQEIYSDSLTNLRTIPSLEVLNSLKIDDLPIDQAKDKLSEMFSEQFRERLLYAHDDSNLDNPDLANRAKEDNANFYGNLLEELLDDDLTCNEHPIATGKKLHGVAYLLKMNLLGRLMGNTPPVPQFKVNKSNSPSNRSISEDGILQSKMVDLNTSSLSKSEMDLLQIVVRRMFEFTGIESIQNGSYSNAKVLSLNDFEIWWPDLKAKITTSDPSINITKIENFIGEMQLAFYTDIVSLVPDNKKESINALVRFNNRYCQVGENPRRQRKNTYIGYQGDTGSGKNTSLRPLMNMGMIIFGSGDGYISKNQEGFYRVFEKTMSGIKLASSQGKFNPLITIFAPLASNVIRAKMDEKGWHDVGLICDGPMRTQEQALSYTKGIPAETMKAVYLTIHKPKEALYRLMTRVTEGTIKLLKSGLLPDLATNEQVEAIIRSDDSSDALKTDNGEVHRSYTSLELFKLLAEKIGKSRKLAGESQFEYGVRVAKNTTEELLRNRQLFLKNAPDGRYYKYKKTNADIMKMWAERGVDGRVIIVDGQTTEFVEDAVWSYLGYDLLPDDIRNPYLESRKQKRVFVDELDKAALNLSMDVNQIGLNQRPSNVVSTMIRTVKSNYDNARRDETSNLLRSVKSEKVTYTKVSGLASDLSFRFKEDGKELTRRIVIFDQEIIAMQGIRAMQSFGKTYLTVTAGFEIDEEGAKVPVVYRYNAETSSLELIPRTELNNLTVRNDNLTANMSINTLKFLSGAGRSHIARLETTVGANLPMDHIKNLTSEVSYVAAA